jgi:monoamine oxidase
LAVEAKISFILFVSSFYNFELLFHFLYLIPHWTISREMNPTDDKAADGIGSETVGVAIVGGGLSGLAAARCLVQAQYTDFKVYEASTRVGGRTLTDSDGTDLGGAYIGPTQDRIMHIIDEFGLKLKKVNTNGKTVQLLNGYAVSYEGMIPPVSAIGAIDLNAALVTMDNLILGINLASPHLSKDAIKWDHMTAEEFIVSCTYTEDARKILRTAVRSILCVEPCQLSTLYLLWYMAQSGGANRIFETRGGAQDSKVIGGVGRVAPLMAEKYTPKESGRLELQCPIRSLEILSSKSSPDQGVLSSGSDSSGHPHTVKLTTDSGRVIYAKHVILAIPPVQMLRIQYTPALPAVRYHALQQWPMGCICKTFMYYETAFWRDLDYNGMIVCDEGMVCVTYDDTNEDGTNPCIMGFVLANQALLHLNSEERQATICKRYQNCFKSDKALAPTRYKEKMWGEEQWVGGCYVGAVGPNVLTQYKRAHCDVYASIVHVAGTEAAHRMIGYMDGAIESGERVARNVLVDLGILGSESRNVISTPNPSYQMPFVPLPSLWFERCLPSVGQLIGGGVVLVLAGVVKFALENGNLKF